MTGGEVLPEWELLLRAAAQLQRILSDATLGRGTAESSIDSLRASTRCVPRLAAYKGITAPWRTWAAVEQQSQALGVELAEAVARRRKGWTDVGPVS